MKSIPLFCLLALGFAACAMQSSSPSPTVSAPLKPLRLVIIGDSTVCNWPLNDNLHREGWGMHIQEYFQDAMQVSNLALSGRSTKTFISEKHWADALALKPDIVLIQFGHNDSHASTNPESTNAATDFRDYLRKYIDETRAIGGTPVLITPVCRRSTPDTLVPYAEAMKIVAAEKKVALIDLHAASAQLYAQLGADGVIALEANLANGTKDPTHFSKQGAEAMAKLVMAEFPTATPQVQSYLKPAGK